MTPITPKRFWVLEDVRIVGSYFNARKGRFADPDPEGPIAGLDHTYHYLSVGRALADAQEWNLPNFKIAEWLQFDAPAEPKANGSNLHQTPEDRTRLNGKGAEDKG